ncbi:MAG: Rrf2 family transcriptional regulator [Oscillospiraceae bacterium]|jgi:Rrf2 family protein|nr:Rrf2 family transcriptional regulator [Oscillospiraceae bacterium]
MHITLETDYAIRIVDLLARKAGRSEPLLDAKSISEQTGVSHRYALKILRKLVAGEIAGSHRGVYGGYRLLKKPEEISLYDVVEIMEGGYKFSRCLDKGYDCSCNDGLPCEYQNVFGEITEQVIDKLKQYKFG